MSAITTPAGMQDVRVVLLLHYDTFWGGHYNAPEKLETFAFMYSPKSPVKNVVRKKQGDGCQICKFILFYDTSESRQIV